MPSYNSDLKPLGSCKSKPLKKVKTNHLQMFFKIGSIKNFAIFTGKHLCWGLFLIKLQVWRSATFLKIDSDTGASCGYYKIFKNSFLIQHLWWLLLAVLPRCSKVEPILWFCGSMWFSFWSKTFTKHCTNNSALSWDKTISSMLELIYHMLSISKYVFSFDEKLAQSVALVAM